MKAPATVLIPLNRGEKPDLLVDGVVDAEVVEIFWNKRARRWYARVRQKDS